MSDDTQCAAAVHSDDIAVDAFASAMKRRMAENRERPPVAGWEDRDAVTNAHLPMLLARSVAVGGNPLDAAILAMMIQSRGDMIAGDRERYGAVVAERRRQRDQWQRIDVA